MTRPRIPVLVLGVVIPAVISVAGILVGLAFVRPGEVVVHWGIGGQPDGWAPAWTVVLGMALLALVAPLTFGLVLVATRREQLSTTQKFLAVVAVWFATFMTALGLWTLIGQQDPQAAPPPVGLGLLICFGAAFALGAVAWFFAPAVTATAPEGRAAEPLKLGAGERAVWIGRTHLATPGIVAIVLTILFALTAALITTIVTEGATGALFLVPAVMLAALLLTSFWTVRADDDGLTVRSAAGWPVFRTPAAQIASAGTTTVRALGEFGGWGIRFGKGRRLGIVMRAGESLEVQNRDGSALVVTVDDAAAAASVLGAVAERAARQ